MSEKKTYKINYFFTIFQVFTGIIGYNKHHNILFTIMDILFAPIVWIKWLIFHEVNLTFIKQCFGWFFK